MRLRLETPPVQWSPLKFKRVAQDLRLLLAESGVAPISVRITDPDAETEPAPKPTYLHLKCTECLVAWYAEAFTRCPSCSQKATVHKATIRNVELPAGAMLGQAVPIQKVSA